MGLGSINIFMQTQELPGLRRNLAQMRQDSLGDGLSGEKLKEHTANLQMCC